MSTSNLYSDTALLTSKAISKNETLTKSKQRKPIKSKPAYQRIKDYILKNIHSGKWQTGDTIPTEYALAEQFQVSRMTVNRSLKELSEERVLQRRQGSGTFVAQQQFNHTFVEVRNIAEDIKATNQEYQAKVVSQRRLTANEVPSYALDLLNEPMLDERNKNSKKNSKKRQAKKRSANDAIDEVKIIHIADGKPIQFEERWVNATLVPHFIEQNFNHINTSDYLIKQAALQGGSYTIRAVAATKEVANALDIMTGEPALLLSRQTYSSGQVITFVNMWHAGNQYQFSGTL